MSSIQDPITESCIQCNRGIKQSETVYGSRCLGCYQQNEQKRIIAQEEKARNTKPKIRVQIGNCPRIVDQKTKKICNRKLYIDDTLYNGECQQCHQERMKEKYPPMDMGRVPYSIIGNELEFGITNDSVIMKLTLKVEGNPAILCDILEKSRKSLIQELRMLTG
jgi:hypothetical protein